MPSNSPTQLSHTCATSGGVPAAIDVMSFCRACACGTSERLHERGALGLRHAELKAHGLSTPRASRRDQWLFPPGQLSRGQRAGGSHALEDLTTGKTPVVVHARSSWRVV